MAMDCSHVPSNVTYNCANPWGQDCTSEKRFDFTSLWSYTQSIQQACPNDTRLFSFDGAAATPQNASLTQASCAAIAGSGWKWYAGADVWTRLTTWKFPLLQLVASFPRPPLSIRVEFFVILHLLGDPVDTIKNLLLKLSTCQRMATYWREQYPKIPGTSVENGEDRDWKALALVTDAYGEWGEENQAKVALHQALSSLANADTTVLRATIHRTADALAADRATKFLPIIVAQCFFIGTFAIAIGRAAAAFDSSSTTIWINIEAHSIAFTAIYFWIIPAVFLGSVIGVSQTEAAIPRILRRFQTDLDRLSLPTLLQRIKLPNECLIDDQMRVFQGGIYSWQPSKWQWTAPTPSKPVRTGSPSARGQQLSYKSVSQDPSQPSLAEHIEDVPAISDQPDLSGPPPHGFRTTAYQTIPSYLIVIIGAVTGMIISAHVPPDGWDCRHWAEILILFAWLLSAVLDSLLSYLLPLNHGHQTLFFWVTGLKDLLIVIATMGGIIATQIGIFNRCSCYTLWGKTGLALPQMPEVATVLRHRLSTVYPALTFVCMGIQLLLIPLFICVRYRHALRVFLQRDDAKSNAARLWKKRNGTSGLEQGHAKNNDSIELQNLTEDPDDIEDGDSFMEVVLAPLYAAQVASNSRASGMQPPSRSNSNRRAIAEPRRRLTEPHNESDSSMAVPASSFRSRPLDERAFVRKPVPRFSRTQGS